MTDLPIGENPIGRFYYPEYDEVGGIIADGRIFDPQVIEVIDEYSGKVALDVGANLGQMAVHMSRRFDMVYAFEAEPQTATILRKNLALNNVTNVVVIEGVVWSSTGTLLPFPEPDGRYNSLGSYGVFPKETDARHLSSITIDSLNLQDVVFMKFDIQGADLQGMIGAKETIQRCKPDIIFEYERNLIGQFDEDMSDYMAFAESVGYKGHRQISDNVIITPKD